MIKIESENNNEHKNSLGEKMCNLNYLSEMVGGKKQLINEILNEIISQVPEELHCINVAVNKSDYSIIKRYAHTMKTSVSIMGIPMLTSVLQEMEDLSTAVSNIEKIKELNQNLNLICEKAIKELEIEKQNYV